MKLPYNNNINITSQAHPTFQPLNTKITFLFEYVFYRHLLPGLHSNF